MLDLRIVQRDVKLRKPFEEAEDRSSPDGVVEGRRRSGEIGEVGEAEEVTVLCDRRGPMAVGSNV